MGTRLVMLIELIVSSSAQIGIMAATFCRRQIKTNNVEKSNILDKFHWNMLSICSVKYVQIMAWLHVGSDVAYNRLLNMLSVINSIREKRLRVLFANIHVVIKMMNLGTGR